jgi:hypothetical protein
LNFKGPWGGNTVPQNGPEQGKGYFKPAEAIRASLRRARDFSLGFPPVRQLAKGELEALERALFEERLYR